MTRRPVIARRVEQLLGVPVVSAAPVAGGDVATAHRLRLNDSRMVFVKTLQHARPGQVAAEANGLARLRETGTVAVPEVLAADDDCLVLDWVEPTRPSADTARHALRAFRQSQRGPRAYRPALLRFARRCCTGIRQGTGRRRDGRRGHGKGNRRLARLA